MANALQRLAARTLGLVTKDELQAVAESLVPGQDSISNPAGYTLISSDGRTVANSDELRRIQERAMSAWIGDPLIKQAVAVKRFFTLGAGITFTAEDPDVDDALHTWWRDETERLPQQLEEWFNSIQVGAELCLRFFPSLDGKVRVRLIPLTEIQDVITDPEDRHVIQYIWRRYAKRVFDANTKSWSVQSVDDLIPGDDVLWLAINKPPGWVRGISPLYAALPWAKAYAEWLQDRLRINKAKGAWAWIRKVTGGVAAVVSSATKLAADIGGKVRSAAAGDEPDRKPPKAGGVINANDKVDWSVVNAKIGADDAKEDGRAIKLQVAAATNVFEHYFGDASAANLATAKAMELPMLRENEYLQGLLGWVLSQVFRRFLRAQVAAERLPESYQVKHEVIRDGKLVEETIERETVDCPLDINWPALKLEDSRKDRAEAAEIEQRMEIKSNATIASELGVEDWEQEQARLFKERQEREARRRDAESAEYPPFPAPHSGDPDAKDDDEDGE